MSTNNKISNLVSSQVPFFVRNDHPQFVKFLEYYYKFLEQEGYPVDIQKNIVKLKDIDHLNRKANTITYNFPVSLNSYAGSINTSNGAWSIVSVVAGMAVNYNANNFSSPVDLTLFNFLATGAANNNFYPYSYADINQGGAVNSADTLNWVKYSTLGTTGNTIIDSNAANVVSKMLVLQNTYPGYFYSGLFDYNTVTVQSDLPPTALELELANKLYETYLQLFPKQINVDRSILLKHAREFYTTRGTEASYRFLMNILFNEQNLDFYYPKNDILKASDGKWYLQKSLRVSDIYLDGIANTNISGLEKFINTIVRGNTSGATATVEKIDTFYESGTLIDELIISNIRGTFNNGEQVFTQFNDTTGTRTATANVFSGIINSVTIINAGSGYNVGDPVIVQSTSGSGANIQVGRVSSGNIASITVLDGGAGYRANDFMLFTGGAGSGSNGYVSIVDKTGKFHSNTYNICSSIIDLEANTAIGNAKYSNLVSSITDPANNWISNSLSFFVYANTGPATAITIGNPGSGYTSTPSISILANTRIQELGILGRLQIISAGQGYVIGDTITITNVWNSYGTGAAASVTNVSSNGAITEVKFVNVPGHITGGAGYSPTDFPTATVVSSNVLAYGANVAVTGLLGYGGSFISANTTLGAIERLIILNRGFGYTSTPTLNLKTTGDGTANASAQIIQGVFTYPGRYINDDGMVSSYNFLQDRDYYQNFSYVMRMRASIEQYRKSLKGLIHPAGTKMFGNYLVIDENVTPSYSADATETTVANTISKTYVKTGNTINVAYAAHGFAANGNVRLEFTSGGASNNKNGIYMITSTTTDNFIVKQPRSPVSTITIVNPGLRYNSNGFIIFTSENGYSANGSYKINANGSIVSANIRDFGSYYSSVPKANANGSNAVAATFTVTLSYYANNTSGNVNVTYFY